VAFPTNSFTPVETANDATGTQNLTVTVPSGCRTLIVCVSDPARGGISAVAWDTAGVNQALTQQGSAQQGSGSFYSQTIWLLSDPTPGTSKNLRVTQTVSGEIGVTVIGWNEPVTVISNGGTVVSAPAGTGQFDTTISAISTAAGDALVSCYGDDGGTAELASPGPQLVATTTYATQSTGGTDNWNGSGVTVASSGSTAISWRYTSHVTAFGDCVFKYVVLRDATPSTRSTPRANQRRSRKSRAHPANPFFWRNWTGGLSWLSFFSRDLVLLDATSGTHPTSGALSAGGSAVSGAADHKTLHTTTGAASSASASVAGTADHRTLHTTIGAIASAAASVAGTAAHQHATTGALSAGQASTTGSAAHLTLHTSTGALSAASAATAGTAAHHHAATGAAAASSAAVSGSAERTTGGVTHTTSGALAADSAAVSGAANHPHTTTGALAASDGSVAGSAAHLLLHTTTGALAAAQAAIAAAAAHEHAASGVLRADQAAVDGAATRSTAGAHDATGALQAGDSAVAGAALETPTATQESLGGKQTKRRVTIDDDLSEIAALLAMIFEAGVFTE
jgi:hypothetical protein